MKRFHVHVAVNDITASVRFYSQIFGAEPSVLKPDYAKWMLEDPRINFAISMRAGRGTGINHLGLQVDSDDELRGMRSQLAAADAALVEENAVNCCYAKSDKYWVTDPQGIAWETWHSLGSVSMFGDDIGTSTTSPQGSGCCTPATGVVSNAIPVNARRASCGA